jgi:hypothetical protein
VKDDGDSDDEYQRVRQAMAGPKLRINEKDMKAVNFTPEGKDDHQKARENLEAKKAEFLGGDEDDLKQLGFIDSDEEIDFSKFKVGRKLGKEVEEETEVTSSLFGRLSSALQNMTGNKVLTAADIGPVLEDFSHSLTDKNVSSEIA